MSSQINPEDYFRLAYSVVAKFLKRNPHLEDLKEDLQQEGILAVLESAPKFKDTGKIQYSTYCAREVQNCLLKYLRDNENKFNNVCAMSVEDLVTPESEGSGDSMDWQDIVSGVVIDVEAIVAKLPPDCQQFISLVDNGMNRHEIRTALGCSWVQFEELKERTISKLQESLP